MESARDHVCRLVAFRTVLAPAVEVGSVTVTPVAKSVALRCGRATLVRSWPSAVLVLRGGRASRLPIVNVTRMVQVAIVTAATLCAWGLWVPASVRKERSS